jgi:hypothetical protein
MIAMNKEVVLSICCKNLQQIVFREYTLVHNQSLWTYVDKSKLSIVFKDYCATVAKSS